MSHFILAYRGIIYVYFYYASYHISFMVLGHYLVYRLYLGLRCIR